MVSYPDYLPTLRFQRTLAFSPDGTMVAYADDALGQFNVTVQSLKGDAGRALTSFTDSAVQRVVWHPDGKSIVFDVDVKGYENTSIYRVDLAGGEPQPIAGEPRVRYATALGNPFSPDGRQLVYTANDRTPGDEDVLARDLATGEVRRLYAGGGRVVIGSWSPFSTRICIAEWRESSTDHVVYVLHPDGRDPQRLTPLETPATYWLGPWLPDGSGFLVRSNAGREFTGLAVMDANTGDLTWLDTPDWDVEEVGLSGNGRTLVWSLNVGGASQLRARDLTTGADLDVPSLPLGMVSELRVSPDAQFAAMQLHTPTRPANLVIVDLTQGDLRWLTDSRPEAADPASFTEPSVIHYPSPDGHRIPAYLYRPQTEKPCGVLLAIHGGPAHQERPLYSVYNGLYQYLLHHGIAIMAPNVRGSTGYGISYQRRIHRDWGGIDLSDFASAADYLRAQTWVDTSRIGLLGGSYGGFCVLSCLARLPHLNWAAGVDLFGPSNLVTFARSQPPTWRKKVATVVGDPEADAELLTSRSPVTYADQIRAPLFVIQGANDPRVPRPESDQIVKRLRDRGVDVRYDVYPDAGHGFPQRADQIKAFSDVGAFLVSHLGSR
jgi:dipeptidyl aminopeptidase/acylaminoacyl peptidase